MKKMIKVAILVLFAAAAVIGQDEHVSGEKIGPGAYEQIHQLALSGVKTVQIQPGQERQFRVLSTVMGRAGMFREVAAPVTWSVAGAQGVTMEQNGKLSVGSNVPNGTKFNVSAKVVIKEPWEEKGHDVTVEQDVIVFDQKANPLVGDWTQEAMTTCEGKKVEVDGNTGLRMLEFRADGTYSAAIAPFEAYRDYWGTYTFDPKKGTLTMTVDGGNNVSRDLRTEGKYEITGGALTLTGLQLYPGLAPRPAPCKTHFVK